MIKSKDTILPGLLGQCLFAILFLLIVTFNLPNIPETHFWGRLLISLAFIIFYFPMFLLIDLILLWLCTALSIIVIANLESPKANKWAKILFISSIFYPFILLIVGNWITQAVPWLLLDMMTLFFSIFVSVLLILESQKESNKYRRCFSVDID